MVVGYFFHLCVQMFDISLPICLHSGADRFCLLFSLLVYILVAAQLPLRLIFPSRERDLSGKPNTHTYIYIYLGGVGWGREIEVKEEKIYTNIEGERNEGNILGDEGRAAEEEDVMKKKRER